MNVNVLFCVALIVAVFAAVESNRCGGQHHDDATICNHTCPATDMKACEYGICTCHVRPMHCQQRTDCNNCGMDHDVFGHEVQQEGHCVDNACECRHPNHHGIHIGPIDIGNILNGGVAGNP